MTSQDASVAAGVQQGSPTDLIADVRTLAWAEAVDEAQTLIEQRREQSDQLGAAWLAAVSWLAHGASFSERWDVAEPYAREVFDGSIALLKDRPLDEEPPLPIALGAAIEVLGRVHDARGNRSEALAFLQAEHARYEGTSIERRIQKNILLPLAVEVGSCQVRFLVNDTEVATQPRSVVDTDGITGLRVNHQLNVHIDDLKLGM